MNSDLNPSTLPPPRGPTDQELVHLVVQLAQAAHADVILFITETGEEVPRLHELAAPRRVLAATTNGDTHAALTQAGIETLRLALRAADQYRQVRHVLAVARHTSRVAIGDLIVCALSREIYPTAGPFLVLTTVEPSSETLAVTDLLRLTNGIRPSVLEAAIALACRIGRVARRGKRLGTILMLGDSQRVLDGARQLVPNPFQGHAEELRRLTNPDLQDALIELAKLDGAFVLRGDGLIQTAGTFLAPATGPVDLPAGLGARHVAAAATTARTTATAVVVSETDGNVRVFAQGKLVLQLDPDLAPSSLQLNA
jgi:DNA integrity scanning protein DisA with diadenylate cyclase activity